MSRDGVETIGQRIRSRRSALGLSQKELAERVGIGRKAVGYLELGRHQPSARRVSQLAAALQASPNWLLTGEVSAGEQEAAQTAGIAEIQRDLAEVRDAIRVLERQLFELYRMVEKLTEQQVRWLGNLLPGDPPWSDSP